MVHLRHSFVNIEPLQKKPKWNVRAICPRGLRRFFLQKVIEKDINNPVDCFGWVNKNISVLFQSLCCRKN